jgi:FAD synthase
MKNVIIIILLVSTLACSQQNQFTYVMENTTNEKINMEGYSISSNNVAQGVEMGEFSIAEIETLLIANFKLDYNDVINPPTFLGYYFEIGNVDSLVMTFENGKKAYFLSSELDNPLTPFDIKNWKLETGVGFKFKITQAHKDAAR